MSSNKKLGNKVGSNSNQYLTESPSNVLKASATKMLKSPIKSPLQSLSTTNFSRPKSIMCHICGKEFGTASISIHIKSCSKLWEEKESKKPLKERRPVPSAPKDLPLGTSQQDLDLHNKLVYESYNENVLIQCPNCLRTFKEESLPIHLKSCTPSSPHKPAPGSLTPPSSVLPKVHSPSPDPKPILRPKVLMCYICGKEFGTSSLEIHLKACAKLWEDREALKPQSERRPLPSAPTEVPVSKSSKNIDHHNQLVNEAFTNEIMVRCPNCLRTFIEDRIEIHLKSCTSSNPHKLAPSASNLLQGQDIKTYVQSSPQVYKEPDHSPKTFNKPKALMCHICGKEYGTSSLEIHVKNCAKMWEERELKKPARDRRPVPSVPNVRPVGKGIDQRNLVASEVFNEQAMVQCQNCRRTFVEDRIEVHLRSCTSEKPHKQVQGSMNTLKPMEEKKEQSKSPEPAKTEYSKTIARPKAVVCHLCGREFGTASIEIHLKSCKKVWEEREMQKPANERRPIPEAPVGALGSKSVKELEIHNNLAMEAYYTKVLVECPHCSRTFKEDRLEVHLRSCTADKPHKAPLRD